MTHHVCRTLAPALFTAGQHTLAAAAADLPTRWPRTGADHERVRQSSQTSVEMVRAAGDVPKEARLFVPPPNSQLCHAMAFNFSFFFAGRPICADRLKAALQGVLGELPHLAGRGHLLGSGSRQADVVVDCNNAGVELATASAPTFFLRDVGPHTWSALNRGHPLGKFPLPFYVQPLDPDAAEKGKEAPLRMRLTQLADGQVLSLSCWHVLADGGRALSLLARLSQHYRGAAGEGHRLSADPRLFHSPADMLEALEARPAGWRSQPRLDDKMSVAQWASAPFKLVQHARTRYDVHQIYLPRPVLDRIKATAQAAAGGLPLSTNDAVQGLLFALIADLRGRPLVPTPHQMVTTNSDLLHSTLPLKAQLADSYFGNAAQIIKLRGAPDHDAWRAHPTEHQRFVAALETNARMVRQGVTAFRADARGTLDAVDEQAQMVGMHRLALAAHWVVKAGDQKTASTSSIAKFPLHTVDFGGRAGGALHVQCEAAPWFDWWNMLMPAPGIDDGRGIMARTVLAHGLGDRLRAHHVWDELLRGAQLCVAGEVAPPLGAHAIGGGSDRQRRARAEISDEDEPLAVTVG